MIAKRLFVAEVVNVNDTVIYVQIIRKLVIDQCWNIHSSIKKWIEILFVAKIFFGGSEKTGIKENIFIFHMSWDYLDILMPMC